MRVHKLARAQHVALHIENPPAICIMIPAGVGVRDGHVKAPRAIVRLPGGDLLDPGRFRKGGRGRDKEGESECETNFDCGYSDLEDRWSTCAGYTFEKEGKMVSVKNCQRVIEKK